MDFLAALDILLALSLIYLVFALVVTSLNESLAAMLSSRAKWLRRGIASLLSTNPKALDEAAAELVAVADLDQPGIVFRTAVTQRQQLLQHDRHLHAIGRSQRI